MTMSTLKDLINKATSPLLTDDDYSLLLDIVDMVQSDTDKYITEAMLLIHVKLDSNDANVILRTLTLIDFLAENCGAMMKGELAKKSFVTNYLLKIVNDNKMHNTIKYAVIKEIYKLSKTFSGDDSLRIMRETFNDLKHTFPYLCEQAQNEVDGGSRSRTGPITTTPDADEDEQLRKAIELSMKDSAPAGAVSSTSAPPTQQASSTSSAPSTQQQSQQQSQIDVSADDDARPDKVRALYELKSNDEETLSFEKGDIIVIIESINQDWLKGCLKGKVGIVPVNYVENISKVSTAELNQLKSSVGNAYDIECLLSKLMTINQQVKSNPGMQYSQFESLLQKDNIPSQLDNLDTMRKTLKQVLDLTKNRIEELECIQTNMDTSIDLYNQMRSSLSTASTTLQPQTANPSMYQNNILPNMTGNPMNVLSPNQGQMPLQQPMRTGAFSPLPQQQQPQLVPGATGNFSPMPQQYAQLAPNSTGYSQSPQQLLPNTTGYSQAPQQLAPNSTGYPQAPQQQQQQQQPQMSGAFQNNNMPDLSKYPNLQKLTLNGDTPSSNQ
ncbi:hypothetical protein B5S28_g3991 [[Candida] boidinii]|nr:hypothetical protein B5S28_g3991 [[Candida] boidinii]